MDYRYIFGVAAGILILASYVPYIHSIFQGRTKPMKSTWISLALLDTLMIASLFAKHAVSAQIAGSLIGIWTLAILSVPYGMPGWRTIDTVTLIIAFIGAALWWYEQDAMFGLIGSTVAYFVSYIPTFVSAWEDPTREDRLAWMMCFISCIFALIAIPIWNFEHAIQPVSFFVSEGVMIFLIFFRPFFAKSKI